MKTTEKDNASAPKKSPPAKQKRHEEAIEFTRNLVEELLSSSDESH